VLGFTPTLGQVRVTTTGTSEEAMNSLVVKNRD